MKNLVFVVLIFVNQISGMALSVCPITMPCACISDRDTVHCAYKNLVHLPFFLVWNKTWRELNLSQNFLSSLPTSAFKGVRVKYLNLQRNSISYIAINAFNGSSEIEELDLSFNHLSSLQVGSFRTLSSLKVLRIKYNQIPLLTPGIVDGLVNLQELDMTGNDLQSVPVAALQDLSKLTRLKLRDNRIKTVPKFAFTSLPLHYIDLGNNGVDLDIQNGAFCGIDMRPVRKDATLTDWEGLVTLKLDHNGLSNLDPCITQVYWTLAFLDLSGNPLNCDCKFVELRENNRRVDFDESQCGAPDDLAGTPLQEFTNNHGFCNETRRKNVCTDTCRVAPATHSYTTSRASNLRFISSLIFLFTTLLCKY